MKPTRPARRSAAWPCGAKARAALASFVRCRAVTCAVPPGGQIKDFTTRCSVVGQGWAMPEAGAESDLAKALDAAKTERLGLWRTD